MNKYIIVCVAIVVIIAGAWKLNNRQNDAVETAANESASQESLRLSINTWVGYAPFYLAKEKGFFADENLAVEILTIEDAAQRKAAVIKGDIDALGDTVDLLVLARDQNVPSVAVMELDESNGADGILVTQDIQTVAELVGKTIAVQRNFVSESFLDYVLQAHNISPEQVNKVDTEAGAAGAAFVSGGVDVAVTFEPWLTKAAERSGGTVLVDSSDVPGVVVDILTIREAYLREHPDAVQKLMRAWFRALEEINAHPKESYTIMARAYSMSPEEFEVIITGVRWPTIEQNKRYMSSSAESGTIRSVARTFNDLFLSLGTITQSVDIESAFNARPLMGLYDSTSSKNE